MTMYKDLDYVVKKFKKYHSLSLNEYEILLKNYSRDLAYDLASCAVKSRKQVYGNNVFLRGLIEISNICKNDCYYCGIRRSNPRCIRYRLTAKQIIRCVHEGYKLGFRTFVLQSGEDSYFSDDILCWIIKDIKSNYSDCAVTLSLGERTEESYRNLFSAGADRYLLRHETADIGHYCRLHPPDMSFKNRMKCLKTLKKIGYQVGAGFMVGTPYQTENELAKDLKFIEKFKPDMCGIGPFISHRDTPFKDMPCGTSELTCYLLSIIRIIYPQILLPSTTALGTITPNGRELGILSGANVVMPNLSPTDTRGKYELYDNKIFTGAESAQDIEILKSKMSSIGYKVVIGRGDIKK